MSDQLTQDQLEQRIEAYKEEIPKCNPLQRDILRKLIVADYKALIKGGRYQNRFLGEILRHRNSGFSAEFTADAMVRFPDFIFNVKEASWADTQGELKIAQKALVDLVKDLYSIVDKEDVQDESHLQRIAQLVIGK